MLNAWNLRSIYGIHKQEACDSPKTCWLSDFPRISVCPFIIAVNAGQLAVLVKENEVFGQVIAGAQVCDRTNGAWGLSKNLVVGTYATNDSSTNEKTSFPQFTC